MEITIDRKSFVSSLAHAQKVADWRSSIPAHAYVHLRVIGSGLTIGACDGRQVYRSGRIAANEQAHVTGGSVALDARRLLAIAKGFAGSTLTIESNDEKHSACVRSGGARADLPTFPVDDLPGIDLTIAAFADTPTVYGISTTKLRDALSVAYASSHDDTRPHLACVLLDLDEGTARGVATDGHRLALRGPKGTREVSIPIASAEQWLRVLGKTDDDAHVFVASNRAGLFVGGAWSVAEPCEERFPPYSKVIPKGNPTTIKIDGKVLAAALKRAKDANGKEAHGVLLSVADGALRVATASSSESIDTMDGSSEAMDVCGFNVEYLLDAVKNAGRSIVCAFAGALDPVVIEGDGSTHVVMPMRV